MKAAFIQAHGGSEVLEYGEVGKPDPAPNEVCIATRAAALNHLDIWIRKGRPGLSLDYPHALGSDCAGIIESVGSDVTAWAPGDEVVINPGISCMRCPWCLRGDHSECPAFTIVGLGRQGTFAEYVTVPQELVYRKPGNLDWAEAAALPLAYLTAWHMVFSRARVQAGETVLIHGIGGGVALAALQLCTMTGLRCIVTSSSDKKLEDAAALGADTGINYRGQDVVETVRELTGGLGVDVVVDSVGAATWPLNFAIARRGGRVVHCGVTTGGVAEADLKALYWQQLSILGSTMGTHEDMRRLLQTVDNTGLRPVIDTVAPLSEARALQEKMDAGDQFGKLVLTVER
jgi:NADPH:quinone reductase-like Zn-dependent oxidoreductase